MLERLPGAEVCRERQRTDDLGSADRALVRKQRCNRSVILSRHVEDPIPLAGPAWAADGR
jgi:hypothetical protein